MMTLPTSHPISLGQVCTEFGAPATTHLGAFLRGGTWVPNTTPNLGVPTSLPISLGDLLGASAATPLSASLSPSSTSGFTAAPGTAISGTVTCTASGGSGGYTYSWVFVSGTAIVVTSPTSASTTFQHHFSVSGSTSSVYKCTVTDSASTVVSSGNETVSLTG